MTLADRLDDIGIHPDDYRDAVTIDGYDEAVIGYSDDGRLIYDYDLMISAEIKNCRCRISYAEAVEYIDYNVIGSYLSTGERHPIIMYRL